MPGLAWTHTRVRSPSQEEVDSEVASIASITADELRDFSDYEDHELFQHMTQEDVEILTEMEDWLLWCAEMEEGEQEQERLHLLKTKMDSFKAARARKPVGGPKVLPPPPQRRRHSSRSSNESMDSVPTTSSQDREVELNKLIKQNNSSRHGGPAALKFIGHGGKGGKRNHINAHVNQPRKQHRK
jgi:hypothetical protein